MSRTDDEIDLELIEKNEKVGIAAEALILAMLDLGANSGSIDSNVDGKGYVVIVTPCSG